MKSIKLYLIVLFIIASFFSGCKKMDSTYKQFIVPGGLTYAGKVTSPMAYAGRNRIKISWMRGSDPNVIMARIFWNNNADSVQVDIPPTGDIISVIIDNLPEQSYSFMIRTYDVKGTSSIPVEILSGSYGEKYQNQLLNRPANLTVIDLLGKITIQWGSADISNGAVASEVKYTDIFNNIKILRFPTSESTSTITDIKSGTQYQYRTVFQPDSLCIDDFFTGYAESGDFNIDKKDWKIIAFSTQHDAGTNAVKNFIDGTDGTRWHSRAGGSSYPHFATIDMGVVRTITQFGVWRTTFENGGDARAPDKIQFLVSTDNLTWTDLGIFNFNRFNNGEQLYSIPTHPIARYFKFVAVQGPENNLVMGEISAYGL